MAEKTNITWCDYTFNFVRGCAEVSPGCDNCYAREMAKRNPAVFGTWGSDGVRVPASERAWKQLYAWNRAAERAGERRRVFCGSLCDVFEDRPDLVLPRARLARAAAECDALDLMLLTKRPQNARGFWWSAMDDAGLRVGDYRTAWPSNVWVGTTIENQAVAANRLRHLLRVPASRRFLSIEPLLGPIKLRDAIHHAMNNLDWSGTRVQSVPEARDFIHEIIIGGESGKNARPCHLDWIWDLLEQADVMGIPAFVKQDSGRYPGMQGRIPDDIWKSRGCHNAIR